MTARTPKVLVRATLTQNTAKNLWQFAIGREIARNQRSEMVIHGRNGQIQDKNSYGNDPFPPKG